MKNILSLIALLSISLSASAQFASNITWGSLAAPGGAFWQENSVNLSSLTLGYFDSTSTFQTVGTLTDGGNGLGLVFGSTPASYDASVIGKTAWVKVGSKQIPIKKLWVYSEMKLQHLLIRNWSVGDATTSNCIINAN